MHSDTSPRVGASPLPYFDHLENQSNETMYFASLQTISFTLLLYPAMPFWGHCHPTWWVVEGWPVPILLSKNVGIWGRCGGCIPILCCCIWLWSNGSCSNRCWRGEKMFSRRDIGFNCNNIWAHIPWFFVKMRKNIRIKSISNLFFHFYTVERSSLTQFLFMHKILWVVW